MAVAPNFVDRKAHIKLENALAAIRKNGGAATPSRYEVIITPPTPGIGGSLDTDKDLFQSVANVGTSDIKDISMKCEALTLPGRNLNSSPDVTIHGPRREVVDGAAFDDAVDMTFTASPDMRERVFFEKWQHAAFNQNTWNVNFYNDYIGTVQIYILDRSPDENRTYGLQLFECFPKTISAVALSYASTNEAIKIMVSMNFRYWKSLDLNMGSESHLDDPF